MNSRKERGAMIRKWIPLSLMLLTLSAHAESQRREPSLLLEYERELKKNADSAQDHENPFTKNAPLLSIAKPTPPAPPAITPVIHKEPKRFISATETIGQDSAPFLIVPKPAPASGAALCPDDNRPTAVTAQDETKGIVKHIAKAKNKVLAKAKEFLGTPYGFGNNSNERTDCSGFTRQVYGQFGISLPHSAAEQARLGDPVDLKDLQVGDLLFYRTYKSDPSHVAIYAGDGQIIHASYNARRVQFDSIDKGYYKERFMYAKRLAFNDDTEEN